MQNPPPQDSADLCMVVILLPGYFVHHTYVALACCWTNDKCTKLCSFLVVTYLFENKFLFSLVLQSILTALAATVGWQHGCMSWKTAFLDCCNGLVVLKSKTVVFPLKALPVHPHIFWHLRGHETLHR